MKIIKDALPEELISFCVGVYEKLDHSKLSPTFMWWPDYLKDGQIAGPFVAPVPSNVVDRLLPKYKNIGFGKGTLSLHFSITYGVLTAELLIMTMQDTMLVLLFT